MQLHIQPRRRLTVLLIFALASVLHAQTDPGFLGTRYATATVFAESLRNGPVDTGYGGELSINVPLTTFLDAGIKASHEKFDKFSITDRRITGSVLGYLDMDTFKPFLELGFTNTVQSSTIAGIKYRNSEELLSLGAGVEAPVTKRSAIFGVATYNHYFNDKFDSYWTYKFGLNTWITPKIGAVFSVSIWDGESTTYSAGLSYRF